MAIADSTAWPQRTLILTPRQTPDAQLLWLAAVARGWSVIRANSRWQLERNPVGECVIYGEGMFVEYLCAELGLQTWRLPKNWLVDLPWELRQRHVRRDECLDVTAELGYPLFLKPDDVKGFPARVYESADDLAPDIAPEDRVMGASVVNWLDEYRCFVKDNAVLTVSKYAQFGELALAGTSDELAEATEYATGILRSPAVGIVKSSVIDVGRIAGVGWAVVEANPTWASGLYECDPSQALDAVAWAFGIHG